MANNHIDRFEFEVSRHQLDSFCSISGDFSGIHISDSFAKQKCFDGRVVHGCLVLAQISRYVGMVYPANDGFLIGLESWFRRPIYIETTYVVTVSRHSLSAAIGIEEILFEGTDTNEALFFDVTARVKHY